jgi:hypothetical protein
MDQIQRDERRASEDNVGTDKQKQTKVKPAPKARRMSSMSDEERKDAAVFRKGAMARQGRQCHVLSLIFPYLLYLDLYRAFDPRSRPQCHRQDLWSVLSIPSRDQRPLFVPRQEHGRREYLSHCVTAFPLLRNVTNDARLRSFDSVARSKVGQVLAYYPDDPSPYGTLCYGNSIARAENRRSRVQRLLELGIGKRI